MMRHGASSIATGLDLADEHEAGKVAGLCTEAGDGMFHLLRC